MDVHALPAGRQHLAGDVAQPAGAVVALGAGLGHDQGPAVPFEDFAQDLPERPVERIPQPHPRPVEDPLVIGVVVEAQDPQVALVAAELGPEPAEDQVPGFELRPAVPLGVRPPLRPAGTGHDVDGGLAGEDASAGVDAPYRVRRRQEGAGELRLELEPAAGGEGIESPHLASRPGPERHLVDRRVPGRLVGLGGDQPGHGPGVGREAVHELRTEDVQIVRPAVVAEVPDHLHQRPRVGSTRCQRTPSRTVAIPRPRTRA